MSNSKTLYPKLYSKDYEKILEEITILASSYLGKKWIPSFQYDSYAKNNQDYLANIGNEDLDFKGYDDVGFVLSRIFADIYRQIITRLNKVPERNFIAFLNMLGFTLSTSVAAKVPVKFNLVKGTPEDILVLAGTKVTADKNEVHDELVFETQENVSITRANISSIISVIKDKDLIYDHSVYLTNKEKFELFTDKKNGSLQEHILYIGNKNIFNVEPKDTKIYLTFLETESKRDYNSLVDLFGNPSLVQWEYNWKLDKGKEIKGSALKFNLSVESFANIPLVVLSYDSQNVSLDDGQQIEKTMINSDKDTENYWIRCRLITENVNSIASFFDSVPSINGIMAWTQIQNFRFQNSIPQSGNTNALSDRGIQTVNSVIPDFLFYNDVPLEVPQISDSDTTIGGGGEPYDKVPHDKVPDDKVYPFGKIPLTFDTFYIASKSVFSKKHAKVFLVFKTIIIKESDPPNLFDHPDVVISWEYWNGNNWNNLKVTYDEEKSQITNKIKRTTLSFTCPEDIEPTTINGVENFWILVRISSGDYGRGTLKEKPVETNPKPGTSLNKPLNLNKRKSARASSPVRENSSPTFEWDYTDVIEPHFTTLLLSAQYNEFVGPIVNEQIRQENKNTTGDKGEEIERSVSKKQIRDVTLDAITYNNLDYKKYLQSHIDEIIESSQPRTFKPFLGFVDNDDIDNKSTSVIEGKNEHPSLYLGFDNKIEKSPTIIYFSIIENLFYEHIESALDFYYFSGISKQWKRLDNIDETRYLQKKGYLKLFLPSDFHNFSLFGRNLYWIKIVDTQGVFHEFNQQKKSLAQIKFPRLQGIYLNTVECVNAIKVQDELLTRQSDTQFLFSKKPLSSTIKDKENQEKIWVREDIGLNDSLENKNFTNSPSVDNLRLVRDSNGNIIESWVLWQERSDLEFSRPNDRHYVIDRKEGILFFGNDINGKAVPAQNNNIVKANFTVGGGKQGNIGLGEIKTLKSLVPLIDSVINTGNGEGGSNMQTAQSGKDRWPSMIENRGQAVTAVDFENIIKNKFVSLSRIKCFSTTNSKGGFSPGEVLVVIIPESFDNSGNLLGKPYPSIELLDNIRDYLMSRSSNVLISNNKLNISGPIYFKVTVSAEIFVKNLDDIVTVEKLALEAIKNFLHPTKGGFDGYGWEFGKSLCASDLYMLFSRLEGVEYVTNISTNIKFDEDNFNENISVGVNEDIVEEKFMDVFVTPITDSKHSNSNYNRLPPSALLYSNNNHNLQVKYDKVVMEQRGEEEEEEDERGPD